MTVRYLPVYQPRRRLSHEEFARRSGVHPDLLRRFVALGLIRASRDLDGRLWFPPSQLAAVARIERLRAGLSLNYASLGLVLELLDRIRVLETALRRQRASEPRPTTRGRSA
ncbi:MAG TPA: chaperone modulator CbpM [Pseudonocardia sp.]|jgi:DNA-binding transcriptional MerR regulator|uniref:chaperone modulator CbpM n=1 Tax=Pseudonocardia sp. TaxID=60912 RepID=UPI002EDBAD57